MIGEEIMSKLLSAISVKTSVVFIGDSNQLPSVSFGNVLEDMIKSERIPFVELKEVFRQVKGSTLSNRIIDIANGKMFSTEKSDDFEFINQTNEAACINAIIARYQEKMIKNKNDFTKVSVLTPTNKGTLGTDNLNRIIQDIANPGYAGKNEIMYGRNVFRNGDLVIQCHNEVEYKVFNGMVGKITRINLAETKDDIESIEVTYPEGKCEYTRDRYDKLKLAYALTIHKSQGSEYNDVIMVIPESSANYSEKKLIYTGMSRARKTLTIISSPETIQTIINKKDGIKRNTNLTWNIRADFSV
jgi:exodeoxyribonuclease V alpha subunit